MSLPALPQVRRVRAADEYGPGSALWQLAGHEIAVSADTPGRWQLEALNFVSKTWLRDRGLTELRFPTLKQALGAFVAEHHLVPAPADDDQAFIADVRLTATAPGRYATADGYEIFRMDGRWYVGVRMDGVARPAGGPWLTLDAARMCVGRDRADAAAVARG